MNDSSAETNEGFANVVNRVTSLQLSAEMNFTDRAEEALGDAAKLAKEYQHLQIFPIHLAVALIDPLPDGSKDRQTRADSSYSHSSAPLFGQVVERAHGDPQLLERALKKQLVRILAQDPPPDNVTLSSGLSKVIRQAAELQKAQKDSFIAIDHLIMALVQDEKIQDALKEAGIPNTKLINSAIQQIRGSKQLNSKHADSEEENKNLSKFTIDLTSMARAGKMDPVIGREEEISGLVRILLKRTKNNAILIGEPGVGKTSIIRGLAQRIVEADLPANLAACKLLSLNVDLLQANSKDRGDFEERMTGVLKEIKNSQETIILFVDEIRLLMGASDMDAARLLKPMLASGELRCIGATTLAEYRMCIARDAALERRFQQLLVKEPSITETISILRGLKERYEIHHGVSIRDGAIIAAATLAAQYITARRLPDSAIDLVDEAAADIREKKPEALDNLERRLRHLEIEIHALKNEVDPDSKKRLPIAQREAQNVRQELELLEDHYNSDKERLKEIQEAKSKLDLLKIRRDEAERSGDLTTASDLLYYAIPDIMARIKAIEATRVGSIGESRIIDTVGPDQVSSIIRRRPAF